jgi:ATP-dependent DNA ligase
VSPLDFIVPAAPIPVSTPPTGPDWLHEIKWDGWRIQVIRDASGVRIYSRNRTDWTKRLPGVTAAAGALKAQSFILDAELIGSGKFHEIRSAMKAGAVSAVAFDLLHLNGIDLRRRPLEERKDKLANLIGKDDPCLMLSAVFEDGEELLAAAEKHGLEGIVSKRRDSTYTSERCLDWLKVKTKVWRIENANRGETFRRRGLSA